jgi:hypothetical protein
MTRACKTSMAIIRCATACLAIIAAFAGCAALLPFRPGPKSIEKRLARITPLGSSFEEVTNILFKRYSSDPIFISEDRGFQLQGPQPPEIEIVGVKSVEVDLGEYSLLPFPGSTLVTAYWGFDDNDKLIRIWVCKTIDAL